LPFRGKPKIGVTHDFEPLENAFPGVDIGIFNPVISEYFAVAATIAALSTFLMEKLPGKNVHRFFRGTGGVLPGWHRGQGFKKMKGRAVTDSAFQWTGRIILSGYHHPNGAR